LVTLRSLLSLGAGFFPLGTVGEADALIERIRELERGGVRELMFATAVDKKWRFSEEFARRVAACC